MSEGWTSVKSLIETVDEALDAMKLFPYGTLYESLCREKSMLLFEEGRTHDAIAYLTESFGVTMRQKIISKSNLSRSANFTSLKSIKEQISSCQRNGQVIGCLDRKFIEFGGSLEPDAPYGYKTRLASLPSNWTVVEISQMDCGPSLCPPHSIPTECSALKPLMICRLGCGSKAYCSDVKFVSSPWPLPCSPKQDILEELNDIIQANTDSKKFGDPLLFRKHRDKLEERFQIVMEAMTDWLAEVCCLLLGRIVNPQLEAKVDEAVSKLARKLNVSKENTSTLNLLVNGSSCLSDAQLKRGLDCILPVTKGDRSSQLQDVCDTIRDLACSVMGNNKESITFTPRHHVILILDKVLYRLPWERLNVLIKQPVTRVPCLAVLQAMHANPQAQRKLDSKSTFYVVDPDNNLNRTAQRLGPIFLCRKDWTGTISKAPSKDIMKKVLNEQDIYLYSGHGAGMHFLPDKTDYKAVAVLVGCSSSNINKLGNLWELHGAPLNFLMQGSPQVLGMLWNIHDRDADKMTVQLIQKWLTTEKESKEYRLKLRNLEPEISSLLYDDTKPCKDLLRVLWVARNASASKLEAAALVATGLPMSVVYHE